VPMASRSASLGCSPQSFLVGVCLVLLRLTLSGKKP
jgi:hypothetical protein